MSASTWQGPVEASYVQLVVRNDGGGNTGPVTLVFRGEQCASEGSGLAVEDLALTRSVDALAPSEEVVGLWLTTSACQRYAAGVDGGPLAPVVLTPPPYGTLTAEPHEQTRFGAASNWMPPWGGEAQPQAGSDYFSFVPFLFTTAASASNPDEAVVQWDLGSLSGRYRLYAYIPSHGPLNGQHKRDASQASYRWRVGEAAWEVLALLDQEQYHGEFVPLGHVAVDGRVQVRLGDSAAAAGDEPSWVLFTTLLAVPDPH